MKKVIIRKKVGRSSGKPRIDLWSKKMIEAGFDFGTPLSIEWTMTGGGGRIAVRPPPARTRRDSTAMGEVLGKRVSRVMNHGEPLPVIDLKSTKALPLEGLFIIGETITYEISDRLIVIKRGGE